MGEDLPRPVLPLLAKPHGPGRHKPKPCPVCRETWFPWARSVLPCHARCLFAPEDQDTLLEICEAGATEASLAGRLGISSAVLRASLRTALARRARLRRAVQRDRLLREVIA